MIVEIPNELGFQILKLVKEGTTVNEAVESILEIALAEHEEGDV